MIKITLGIITFIIIKMYVRPQTITASTTTRHALIIAYVYDVHRTLVPKEHETKHEQNSEKTYIIGRLKMTINIYRHV